MEALYQIGTTLSLNPESQIQLAGTQAPGGPGKQGGIPAGQTPEVSPVSLDPKVSSLEK